MDKKSRLRRNFIASILLIMVLLIIIPFITLYFLTRAYDDQIRIETDRTSLSIRYTVRAFTDGAYNLCYELAVNKDILTMDSSIQTPIIVNSVERNDYLELIFIQGMDGIQTSRTSGELSYRGDRQWFLYMTETKQPYISESYISLATGIPVTSIFIPMFNDSEMIGILGADISLDYLQRLAEQFADYEDGRYSFIIDGNGVVIAHPDSTVVKTLTHYKSLFKTEFEIINRHGLIILQEDDITYYASYESIFLPGYSEPWTVITLQDKNIAMSAISKLVRRVFIIISIIFVVFIVIAFGFFKSLDKTMTGLENAKIEAERANRSKSAFLSTMSHEIRTPMNAILGLTEIKLFDDHIDSNMKETLEKIHVSGDMLLGIINDILDLSKIEAGRLEIIINKYEIASMLSDTIQLNMMRIGSKPIKFRLDIDENLPAFLLGDELRIKQLLNNLLSNAFKYTMKGNVNLSVSMEPDNTCNEKIILIFTVSDTGQGMSKEQVEKLFDEYERFNQQANRTTEGTGLGMSITRNLLRLMNGEIFVESELGKGSAFTVRLPQEKTGSEILGKETAENLRKFRASPNRHLKHTQIAFEPMPYGSILIVDDVETNIDVAKGLLAPYRLKIDSANSGMETINKIKNGNVYDIIFLDHMMPVMDGIETAKKLREIGYKHPVIALTANAITGQSDLFLKNGFDDFISKPIDMRRMNAVLNRLIRDKQPPEVLNEITKALIQNIAKAAEALENLLEKKAPFTEEEFKLYTGSTREIKTALVNIGESALDAFANKLEEAGREKNITAILNGTPVFLNRLKEIIRKYQ